MITAEQTNHQHWCIWGQNPAERVSPSEELKAIILRATRLAFEQCTLTPSFLDYLIEVSQGRVSAAEENMLAAKPPARPSLQSISDEQGPPFWRLGIKESSFDHVLLAKIGLMSSVTSLVLMNPSNRDFRPRIDSLQSLKLTRVRFENFVSFSDEALIRLSGFARLTVIQVINSAVTGSGLHHLKKLRRLQSLWLDDAPLESKYFQGDYVLPELKTLGLVGALRGKELFNIDWRRLAPKLEEVWMDPSWMSAEEANAFEQRYGGKIAICFPPDREDFESGKHKAQA